MGVHAHRTLGMATVDLAGTFVLALASAVAVVVCVPSLDRWGGAWLAIVLLTVVAFAVWFAAAMGLHLLFGVDTKVNVALFGRWRALDAAGRVHAPV